MKEATKNSDNGDAFLYDDHGRVITQTRTIDGREFTQLTLSFDSLDRPLTVRYPDGEVIAMTYDREGVDRLTAGGEDVVDGLTYNARGQLVDTVRHNGVNTTNSYGGSNDNFRLQTAATAHSSTPLLEYGYAYDLVENVTTITETVSSDQQVFIYDTLNRLTAATGSGSYGYNHIYEYDVIGNMTKNAGAVYGYEDGAHVHAVTDLDGVEKFQYDGNGNMISRVDGTTTYEQGFDVENRLVVVTNTNTLSVTQFAYDAGGLRVKTVEPDGTVIYTPFPNYEETVAGSSTTVRAYYLLGGQAIAMRASSDPAGLEDGLYFIHTDHLGSTTLLTDGSGGVVGGPTRYYPYGDYRGTPGTGVTDRGFTGHRGNNLPPNDLGLIYMNARYYVVYLNRFLSADTIIPNPADPQSYNRYSYARNNPINFIDPSGHFATFENGGGSIDDCKADLYCYTYPAGHDKAGWEIGTTQADIDESWDTVTNVGATAVGLVWEPADWAYALSDGFQPSDAVGLLPIIPAAAGRWGDDALDIFRQFGRFADDAYGPYRILEAANWREAERVLGDLLTQPQSYKRFYANDYPGLKTNSFRVPDFVTDDYIADAKFYTKSSLALTTQLEDYATIAKQEGLPLYLLVHENTKVSDSVLDLIKDTGGVS